MALTGELSELHPADLIQLTCQSGGQAKLTARRDGEEIVLYFDGGEVVHAVAGTVQGAEAVYELLTWDRGHFEVEPNVPAPVRTVTLPWAALIMEGLRRLDERRDGLSDTSEQRKERATMNGETRRERLAKTLRHLVETSGDVSGVAVVSPDGLIMAADLPADVEQARVGAVAAAILSLSRRSTLQLKRGTLRQTMVQGDDGNIIITHAGPNAVLVALTNREVNLGMVFLEVRECAEAVSEILG